MMDLEMKKRALEEILAHLRDSQGGELGALVKKSKEPAVAEVEMDVDPAAPKNFDDKANGAIKDIMDPDGTDPESPEMKGGMPDDGDGDDDSQELSDEELEELLKKFMS